jgi:hypothetical protein
VTSLETPQFPQLEDKRRLAIKLALILRKCSEFCPRTGDKSAARLPSRRRRFAGTPNDSVFEVSPKQKSYDALLSRRKRLRKVVFLRPDPYRFFPVCCRTGRTASQNIVAYLGVFMIPTIK